MSEKRFSLEYCDNMFYVKDNFNDNEYYLYWAVELMNELYEENEQLRKENVFLAKQRNYWKSKCAEWMGVKEENLSLRCVNMSEKQFTTKGIIISNYGVWDTDDKPYANDDVVDLLNEQQNTIKQLQGKIKRLNAFLVSKDLAIEYLKWNKKGDVYD